MSRHRPERVADVMRRELAQIFRQEIKDPRATMATVSSVSLSSDLGFARIKVSVLGSDAERDECLAALQRATGFVRTQLAHRLGLRVVPELRFELDRGAEHSQRIDQLLAALPELAQRSDDGTPATPEEPDEH